MFMKPTTAFRRIDFGSPWYGAVRERVAVDGEEDAHARDASSSAIRAMRRSVASCEASRRSSLPRSRRYRPESRTRHGAGRSGSSRSVPATAAGTSGTAGLERDSRGARCAGRASCFLTSPFVRRVPSGNIMTVSPSPREPDGGGDCLGVGEAAVHLERTALSRNEARRPPVELRFRHEAEPDLRPDRHPERPRIEARHVVAREDEAARGGEILLAPNPQTVEPVEHGPAQRRDDVVDRRRSHFTKQYPSCGWKRRRQRRHRPANTPGTACADPAGGYRDRPCPSA
jgi:hypothetical protein